MKEGIIRIRKCNKVRQYNGQKKRDKGTNNDLYRKLYRKLKNRGKRTPLKQGWTRVLRKGKAYKYRYVEFEKIVGTLQPLDKTNYFRPYKNPHIFPVVGAPVVQFLRHFFINFTYCWTLPLDVFRRGSCCLIFSFLCVLCRSLFVFLFF